MATANIGPLSSLNNQQLREALLGDHEQSFRDATAAYMQGILETESKSIQNMSETMSTETEAQNGLTQLTKALNDQVVQEIENQPKPSSMPSWLSDIVGAFSILASVVTLNPFLIGMSVTAFSLQVSGGMNAMMKAVCGDDLNKQAAFTFGFALGEALLCGGGSVAGDVQAANSAVEAGAETGTKTVMQRLMKDLPKYMLTYLGQGLMLDNFWPTFFQGPCKLSEENAQILGMITGVGFGMGSMAFASSNEDGLTEMIRNKFAKLPDQVQKMFRYATLAGNLTGDGFQIGSGVEQIQISNQYKELAAYMRNVMAGSMSNFSLIRNLTSGMNTLISQTQDALQVVSSDGASMNQTFSSFAQMFKTA